MLRDAINGDELRETILELDEVERSVIQAQLYNRVAEHAAEQNRLREKWTRLMETYNDARTAFSDSVRRELAR